MTRLHEQTESAGKNRAFLPGKSSLLRIRDVRSAMPRLSGIPEQYPAKEILGVIVHHSATVTPSTGRPVGNAESFFRHFVRNLKWDHGGYHYIILPNGSIEYALDEREDAYQAGFSDPGEDAKWEEGQYWNHHYLGVCLVGWFDQDREYLDGFGTVAKSPNRHTHPSRAQYRSLVLLLHSLQLKYGFPVAQILGHRECYGQSTVCPGLNFDLVRLRSEVDRLAGKPPPVLRIAPGESLDPDWHGSPPANIRLLGALKRTVNRALRMGGKLVIAALLPMNLYLWMQTPTLGLIVLRSILVLATGFLTLFLFLRWVNPPTTAFILQDQRRRHRKGLPACHDRIWVPLRSISPSMRLAAVVAEDMRFLEHTGLEWYGMVLAWRASRSGAPLRGYSTISQQLVKNLFLWPAQTYTRKLIEAAISIAMECLWPKERILEIYLNVVQFGEGLYGIAAASRRYFNTTPEKLDDDQAAWLAAILPDPVGVQVGQPQARVVRRVEEIRASMNAHAARNAPIFTTVI